MKRITQDLIKKSFCSYFLLALTVAAGLSGQQLSIPKNYKFIKCKLKPVIRESRQKKKHTHPHIPTATEGTSINWSGYVAATNLKKPLSGAVTSVSGSWVVPSVSKSSINSYSAIWVGIDGFANGTVEQIGTEQDWTRRGANYYAWFEMYPNASYQLNGFPVDVGDSISASVVYSGNDVFKLTIANNTKKVHTVVPTTYTTSSTAKRSSAEWIVEAPSSSSVIPLPLANFGTVSFSKCSATINGVTGAINNPKWVDESFTMTKNNGVSKAVPSSLSPNGKRFTVTWKHH